VVKKTTQDSMSDEKLFTRKGEINGKKQKEAYRNWEKRENTFQKKAKKR